jgi:hypothetical protein
MGIRCLQRKESDMKSTTVAVDLAKSVFQLAVADASWKVIETHRLTRSQFERWFHNRDVSLVVMESCGSAHHSARHLSCLGIEVKLLPAKYVRAYVKRNKTDAADAAALLEAARASDIEPVRVKSVEQQALQGLHRTRSLWMGTRTGRINALRGLGVAPNLAVFSGSAVALTPESVLVQAACAELGIRHLRTRPYTPKTNGKVERSVQTSLREWAYARPYESSAQREAALQPFIHRYNWHSSTLGHQPSATHDSDPGYEQPAETQHLGQPALGRTCCACASGSGSI